MSKRIHSLEGREERVHELGNMAHGKQELTCWRGGRGRSGLVSSEMWHVANKVPSWGREGEERGSELGNVAGCKKGRDLLEGGRRGEEEGGGEGKEEENRGRLILEGRGGEAGSGA